MATDGETPGRYLLLYGSQTGQAQAIAEEIFERSAKHGLSPDLYCMSMMTKKFHVENERYVVIVTSTTGDGDPPDTAIKFVRRFNRKTLPSDFLADVNYTILGLGDSNYGNFCNNAKVVDRRFRELGAHCFTPCVFADEVEGLDVKADPWMDALFPALQKELGVSSDSTPHKHSASGGGVQCNGTHNESHNNSTLNSASNDSQTSENKTQQTADVNKTDEKTETILKLAKKITDHVNSTSDTVTNSTSSQNVLQSDVDRTLGGNNISTFTSEKDGVNASDVPQNITHANDNQCNGVEEKTDSDEKGESSFSHSGESEKRFLTINVPASDVPSLGVSTPALSEKSLTLPAASPAFLAVSYLPSDQNLAEKMAALPWQNGCKAPSAASDIIKSKVVSAQRLTTDDAVKKTLLLKLNFQGNKLKYRAGDSISIICSNQDREVSQLILRLGLESVADAPVKLSVLPDTKKRRAAVPPHIPEEGVSLRYIFTHCIDFREPPKKALLRLLVDYTSDVGEKRRLQELCSKEGGEDYSVMVHGQHVSLLDVLYTFPSCHPPVERLIEHLPRLQPRPYSICSCEDWNPDHLDIAFNVVDIPASHSRLYSRRGLCTGWLDDVTSPIQVHAGRKTQAFDSAVGLTNGVASVTLSDIEVQIFSRTNQHFRTPDDLSLPLILIGPGTGIAPYIGFLQERQLRMERGEKTGSVGETWLLFGCRHKAKDFLFHSAIQHFQHKRVLTKFLAAFSRDSPDKPSEAKYVQDNIRSHGTDLCDLIDKKQAVVFVCGDAKHMAPDVASAFQDIFMQELDLGADKAKEYIMTLRIRHRYLEDVWT